MNTPEPTAGGVPGQNEPERPSVGAAGSPGPGCEGDAGREAVDKPTVIGRYERHVNPAFIKLLGTLGYGRVFARAEDVWIWDHEGRRYLDCLAGFGSVNLGHNHPRLVERLQRHLQSQALNLCHTGPSLWTADLAALLARLLPEPLTVSLFSSSGAEGVEAGMKLARAATQRLAFLSCTGGFHGTNFGSLSVMGADRMRQPFEPLLAECVRIPFGQISDLEAALSSRRFAAFVVEPLQSEAGVVLPPSGYLAAAQELCRRFGTLLVLDEVQTGLGRTGTLFAQGAEGFVPDVIVLAKALGGSLAPIAATVTSAAIHGRAYGSAGRFDLHSSTYGGNALSCVAALETLKIIDEQQLVANSAERGGQMLAALRTRLAGHPLVREVRGRGLLIGIELGPTDSGWWNRACPLLVEMLSKKVFGQWIALRLLERGILCQPAAHQWNVLKLEPPLTINAEHQEQILTSVTEVLEEYRGVTPLLKDVTQRLGRQFLAGWTF